MTLDQFITELYFMPPEFVPTQTGDRLEYYVNKTLIGPVEAMWMWKFQKSIKPFFIDAGNALNISHPDLARLSNAMNFAALIEWPFFSTEHDRLRIDLRTAMWRGKL